MLHCAVKFCGGCNPRYDRALFYETLREKLLDIAVFSIPQDGERYDVLVIIRGCSGCPYLYEEVKADTRLICERSEDLDTIVQSIKAFANERGLAK